MLKSPPQRRLTSVFDLENPGGYFGISLKFPSTKPGLLPLTQLVPFEVKHRS